MRGFLCKPGRIGRRFARGAVPLVAGVLAVLPACRFLSPTRTIALADLEAAPAQRPTGARHVVVSDAQGLRALCKPLGPRLGLIEVRSAEQWRALEDAAPQIGACPDLRRGTVVGIVAWGGTPLNGGWPVEFDAVQVHEGGGLLKAKFKGGTYLPDGTARLETGYVPGLHAVLVVDVNGTPFYVGRAD